MPGSVKFEYDENLNIVFTEDHWEIQTKQDVDEFFAEYQKYFQRLNKKVYMISNIDDLLVHAEVADYYGEVAKNTVAIFLLGFARYGTKDWARMTVRTTSLKAKFSPNIYSTREEAIKAIEKQKQSRTD
ncbi:MAG: hypothetical protein ABIL20_03765 [candidate division WOR-3 bacterium]